MCEPVYKAGTGYELRRIQFQPSGVSEKDAISVLVCVYFPLTLWVKISLTITSSEYVPAHPMLHHQVIQLQSCCLLFSALHPLQPSKLNLPFFSQQMKKSRSYKIQLSGSIKHMFILAVSSASDLKMSKTKSLQEVYMLVVCSKNLQFLEPSVSSMLLVGNKEPCYICWDKPRSGTSQDC